MAGPCSYLTKNKTEPPLGNPVIFSSLKDPWLIVASVLQTRDKLVKLRTTLKNKINNLLAGQGILIRRESLSSDKGWSRRCKPRSAT
jgi:hypothetical protein